jgi:hypothetical protein
MHLTQILLPLPAGRAARGSKKLFAGIRKELTDRFGGVTAYVHSPAEGEWVKRGEKTRDSIIVVEVMSRTRQRQWWGRYRKTLEARLAQELIVIRTYTVSMN